MFKILLLYCHKIYHGYFLQLQKNVLFKIKYPNELYDYEEKKACIKSYRLPKLSMSFFYASFVFQVRSLCIYDKTLEFLYTLF